MRHWVTSFQLLNRNFNMGEVCAPRNHLSLTNG
jgi:hypothetical protein